MVLDAFPSCLPFFFIFKNIFKILYMSTIKHIIIFAPQTFSVFLLTGPSHPHVSFRCFLFWIAHQIQLISRINTCVCAHTLDHWKPTGGHTLSRMILPSLRLSTVNSSLKTIYPVDDRILVDSILCGPWAGNPTCCGIMIAVAMPCPEDSISQLLLRIFHIVTFFPLCVPVFPEPWWQLG